MFSRHPILRWQFYKANRKILGRLRELDHQLEETRGETERNDQRIQRLRRRIAALIADLDAVALEDLDEERGPEQQAHRAELQVLEDELREMEKAQDGWRAISETLAEEARRIKDDYLAEYAQASDELRKFLAQDRDAWLKAIRDIDMTQSRAVDIEKPSGGEEGEEGEGPSPRP